MAAPPISCIPSHPPSRCTRCSLWLYFHRCDLMFRLVPPFGPAGVPPLGGFFTMIPAKAGTPASAGSSRAQYRFARTRSRDYENRLAIPTEVCGVTPRLLWPENRRNVWNEIALGSVSRGVCPVSGRPPGTSAMDHRQNAPSRPRRGGNSGASRKCGRFILDFRIILNHNRSHTPIVLCGQRRARPGTSPPLYRCKETDS